MNGSRTNDFAPETGGRSRQMHDKLVGMAAGRAHPSSLGEEAAAKVLGQAVGQRRDGTSLVGRRFLPERSIDLSVLDTSRKRRLIPKAFVDHGTIVSSRGRVSGDSGVASSGQIESTNAAFAPGEREKKQHVICPGCHRSVDRRKLPIFLDSFQLRVRNRPTPKTFACSLCKMPFERQNRAVSVQPAHTNKATEPVSLKLSKKQKLREKKQTKSTVGKFVKISPDKESKLEAKIKNLVSCRFCCVLLPLPDMERHLSVLHSKVEDARTAWSPLINFPFELLPPDHGAFLDEFEHIWRRSRPSRSMARPQFDPRRLENMLSLNPKLTYMGKKGWLGYAVYEFTNSSRVILESPIEKNATYVLSGDWKQMISHTKAEIRMEYQRQVTRIFHTDSWRDRVRQALRNG